ncbi:hypothetical protein IW140_000016 [Coemansia sp. RSA 1813]|nr:hypothetical protein EV179_000447 [Coemansia sp. RSA 487]KAJ2573375.1 hypothetical protein IW140_000016 [Coemansia sp. RSA 1813]
MSKRKVLAVGVSETLNLKAEIERATTESKQGSSSAVAKQRNSASAVAKKNRGVHERAQSDLLARTAKTQSSDPQAQNERTKRALEEKARIYDMLSSMGNDEKGNNFLGSAQLDDPYIARIIDESSVDFARKQMDKRIEKLTQNSGSQASLDSPTSSDRAYSSSLVEIIDEFGRSRMVPRSKAKYYHSKDYETSSDSDSANDIRFDENDRWSHRDRGTSHYNLASDSIKRDEQLDTLRELHEETLKARETSSNVVDMQQTMLSARREQIRTSRKRTTCKEQRKVK